MSTVAARLGKSVRTGWLLYLEGRWTYDFGGFHHWELPEVACEEADPEEGGFPCERGELAFDVVCGLVFALRSKRLSVSQSYHITDLLAKHTSI